MNISTSDMSALFRLPGRVGALAIDASTFCSDAKAGASMSSGCTGGIGSAQAQSQADRPDRKSPLLFPETPNHAWSMDFVHDGLADGRRLRCLNVA